MRALHVVVVYLPEGAGVDMGLVGKQYVAVGLESLGLGGAVLHEHVSVEARTSRVVDDALVQLAAVAVGLGVFHEDVVVALLLAVYQVQSVGLDVAVFAVHAYLDVVAHVAPAEGDGVHAQLCPLLHSHLGGGDVFAGGIHALQAVELERTVFGRVDLQQGCRGHAHGFAVEHLDYPGVVGDDDAERSALRHRQQLWGGVGRHLPLVAPGVG